MGLFAPASRNRIRMRLAPYDAVCAVVSPFAALALRDPGLLLDADWSDGPPPTFLFACISICFSLLFFVAFRISDGMTRYFSVHDVGPLAGAVITSVSATSLVMFTFTRMDGVPRSTPLILALFMGGMLIVGRSFQRLFAVEKEPDSGYSAPDKLRNVIIVGANRFSAIAARLVASQLPATTRVVAFVDERSDMIGRTINGVRIVASTHDLASIIDEYESHGIEIDNIWISDQTAPLSAAALAVIEDMCAERRIELSSLGDAFNLRPRSTTSVADAPELEQGPELSRYFVVKRAMDIVGSSVLLAMLAPVSVLVAALVILDVGTPALFWQERLGQGGRRFLLYKFRTYKAPFDWRGDPIPEDRRISRIGRLLRRSRLDEIPQLLNVMVGDMSLIGPRPLLPVDQPTDPSARLAARPGITGWAQVQGGNKISAEDKDALDAWYIEHASLWVDIKIIIHSLIIAVSGERLDTRAIRQALDWRQKTDEAKKSTD